MELIAHRGASYLAPENTLSAFALAWELGVDGVEGDFRLTRDGRIVCIHDDNTLRTSGLKYQVAQTTFKTLRSLDVGLWRGDQWKGEVIPTLEECFSLVPRGKKFFLEVKAGPEIVGPLLKVLRVQPVDFQLAVLSFDQQVLDMLAHHLSSVPTYLCLDRKLWQEILGQGQGLSQQDLCLLDNHLRRLGVRGVALSLELGMQPGLAAGLKALGLEVNVWTVDDPNLAQRLVPEVNSITSNRPELFISC